MRPTLSTVQLGLCASRDHYCGCVAGRARALADRHGESGHCSPARGGVGGVIPPELQNRGQAVPGGAWMGAHRENTSVGSGSCQACRGDHWCGVIQTVRGKHRGCDASQSGVCSRRRHCGEIRNVPGHPVEIDESCQTHGALSGESCLIGGRLAAANFRIGCGHNRDGDAARVTAQPLGCPLLRLHRWRRRQV